MVVLCKICENAFSTQSNLNVHLRRVHKQDKRNIRVYDYDFSRIKCLTCASSFRFTSDLRYHLQLIHNEIMEEENLNFKSTEGFQRWLNSLHKTENVQYIKREARGKVYYYCNRSGQYNVKEKTLRKRALKSQGSCKIGYACTSEIIVHKVNSKYNVTYHKTHYGHKLEVQHVHIPKQERSNIALKLASGVPVSKLLDLKRSSLVDGTIRRKDVITRKDIHNIKNSFQKQHQEGIGHQSDATSVELWVKECGVTEQIIIYVQEEDDYEPFRKDDFCTNKNIKLSIISEANNIINNIYSVNDEAVLHQSLNSLRNINGLINVKESNFSVDTICEKIKEESSDKNPAKQLSCHTIKKKTLKKSRNIKPNKLEVKNIKRFLNDENGEFVSKSSSNDHAYL